jgi:hypothetical protein
VGVLGGAQRDRQRLRGAEGHLDVRGPAQVQQREIVGRHLRRGHVAGRRGDAEELGLAAGEKVEQPERIVDAGVDIHDDLLPHGGQLNPLATTWLRLVVPRPGA